LYGQHSLKFGGEFDYTWMTGDFSFRPIVVRRRDQTISERIEFTGPTAIKRALAEFGGFAQDRWAINKRLTIDAGLRFDRDSISTDTSIAPGAATDATMNAAARRGATAGSRDLVEAIHERRRDAEPRVAHPW